MASTVHFPHSTPRIAAEYRTVVYGENVWYFSLRYGWNYSGYKHRAYQKLPCRDYMKHIILHFHAGWPLYYRLGGNGKLMVGRDESMALYDAREVLRAIRRWPVKWLGIRISEGEEWEEGPGWNKMLRLMTELKGMKANFALVEERREIDEQNRVLMNPKDEERKALVQGIVKCPVAVSQIEDHWLI